MRFTPALILLALASGCRTPHQDVVFSTSTEDDPAALAAMAERCAELSECGACVSPTPTSGDSRPLRCGWCAAEQRCEPHRRTKPHGKSKDVCGEPLLESEPLACAVSDTQYRQQAVGDFFTEQLNGYKRTGKPVRGAVKSGGHVAVTISSGSCYRLSYKPLDEAAMSKASASSIGLDLKLKKKKDTSAGAKAAALAYGDEHFFASVWDVGCPKSSGQAVMNFPFDVDVAGKYELQAYKRPRTKKDLAPPPKTEMAAVAVADGSGSLGTACRTCSDERKSCDGSRGHCNREYASCLSHEGYMAADCQQKAK